MQNNDSLSYLINNSVEILNFKNCKRNIGYNIFVLLTYKLCSCFFLFHKYSLQIYNLF